MPLENIQFALIWPVFPMRHQTGLDGVFNDIEPFLVITLTTAKLSVIKIFLPNGFVASARPAARYLSTPEFHPTFERRHLNTHRGTEKVDMIRHNNMAPHQPVIRFAPCFKQESVNVCVGKQLAAVNDIATDVLNDRLIWKFHCRQVR